MRDHQYGTICSNRHWLQGTQEYCLPYHLRLQHHHSHSTISVVLHSGNKIHQPLLAVLYGYVLRFIIYLDLDRGRDIKHFTYVVVGNNIENKSGNFKCFFRVCMVELDLEYTMLN